MKRPVGVAVIAILSLLGSVFLALFGVLSAFGMVMAFTASSTSHVEVPALPGVTKGLMIIVPLFYFLPAGWGISSGIGLLRLKNWARISTVVFSVLLIVHSVFGFFSAFLIRSVLQAQSPVDSAAVMVITIVVLVFALAGLGVGIWWLVYLSRSRVRVAFTASYSDASNARYHHAQFPPQVQPMQGNTAIAAISGAPTRPISITIIGWYLLATSVAIPVTLVLRLPVPFMALLLTGWQSVVYVFVLASIQIYCGWGLLRRDAVARLIAIGYLTFSLMNSLVFYFWPGASERISKFLELEQAIFPWLKSGQEMFPMSGIGMKPLLIVGIVPSSILVLVIVYFLVREKQAFVKTGAAKTV